MPLAGLRQKRKSNFEAYKSESDSLPPSYPQVLCFEVKCHNCDCHKNSTYIWFKLKCLSINYGSEKILNLGSLGEVGNHGQTQIDNVY